MHYNIHFTSVGVRVGWVVCPDLCISFDVLGQTEESGHEFQFSLGAVVRDIYHIEESKGFHGVEDEGIDVRVVVHEVRVGDPGY